MVFTVDASNLNIPASRKTPNGITSSRNENGALHTSVINADKDSLSSNPVLIEVVDDSKLGSPIVKLSELQKLKIINLEKRDSVRKIKIDSKSEKK